MAEATVAHGKSPACSWASTGDIKSAGEAARRTGHGRHKLLGKEQHGPGEGGHVLRSSQHPPSSSEGPSMEPPHIHAVDTRPHRGQKQGSGSGLPAEHKPFWGNVLNGGPYGPEKLPQ